MNWLIIVLVSVPTTVALYYMAKANRTPENKEVIIRLEIHERLMDESIDATQTEWEFKQYHKN